MAEPAQIPDSDTVKPDPAPDPQTELILGLVGAAGVDTGRVVSELTALLRYYRYETAQVRLSSLLPTLTWSDGREFPDAPYDVRVRELMRAGTDLRSAWGRGEALALMAVATIAAFRRKKASLGEHSLPKSLDRCAFVLHSFKHPAEVDALRGIYGPRFFLVGAYAPRVVRQQRLAQLIADDYGDEDPQAWKYTPDGLMERDEAEAETLGQQLRDTFHRADFFIDASDDQRVRRDLERTLALIFADPFVTPTQDEHALFAAEGSSRRSAELGRQVGASIATPAGSVIALGTNEVPAPGGGQYWDNDQEGREFHRAVDTNDERQRAIAEEIGEALRELGLVEAIATANTETLRKALLETSLGDLTEFGRAVHAEMAALLDAANRGVPVNGCTLFTTTFPCHNCARHIIAAGIRRVVYVAPYAKSKAWELHRDAIEVAAANPDPNKVQFQPFVGVAPRRYLELFDADWRERSEEHIPRKNKETGAVATFDKSKAKPVFADLEPLDMRPVMASYRLREAHALALTKREGERTGLGLQTDVSDKPDDTGTGEESSSTEGEP